MTDLSKMREYQDPWGGTEQEWAPEAVRKWGRGVAFHPEERPLSVGLPGLYFTPGTDEQGRARIFQTKTAPKGAATIDPMMGLITEGQALSAARGIIRTRFSKWGAGKLMNRLARKEAKAIEQLDMEDLVKQMPEGLWARIKSFKRTARHSKFGDKYTGLHTSTRKGGTDIWVDPHSADPASVMTHEVAHEAGDAFLEWSRKQFLGKFRPNMPPGQRFDKVKPGAFAKLRKEWGEIAADMRYLETSGQAGSAKSELYSLNPDEIFANRFSEALNEGMDFNQAVKFGAHEVRANLSASRDLVNRVNKEIIGRRQIPDIAF